MINIINEVRSIFSILKIKLISICKYIYHHTEFLIIIIIHSSIIIHRPKLILEQIFFIGNRSISIIVASGLFVGLVLGLQGYHNLQRYGSEQTLGLIVSLSLIRELGPVLSALLFTGRAATALTAEIGLMKTGEQISAIEMMAINPMERVLTPRFIAGIISLPILSLLFNIIGIIGGWIIGVLVFNLDNSMYWALMQDGIDTNDILNSIIKSIFFGLAILSTSLYEGWYSKTTPEGVSLAITNTVVTGSLYILSLDLFLTAIMFTN